MLFLRRVAALTASAYELFLKKEDFPPLNIAHTLLNRVTIFFSKQNRALVVTVRMSLAP